jgi:hypothetical protein
MRNQYTISCEDFSREIHTVFEKVSNSIGYKNKVELLEYNPASEILYKELYKDRGVYIFSSIEIHDGNHDMFFKYPSDHDEIVTFLNIYTFNDKRKIDILFEIKNDWLNQRLSDDEMRDKYNF